ncbi:MAG: hypothetical protein JWQ04_303 [Pedosphaera sp.]|nr:hypothetical protein [Pedosphaera sp.]
MTQSGFDPASRFRFIQFIPHLQRAGWIVEHRPNRPDRQWISPLRSRLARAVHYRTGRWVMTCNRYRDILESRDFDALFVNRDFAGEGPWLNRLFRPAMRRGVFDFDDAVFVGPNEARVRWMCANARWVTPGNEFLAGFARRYTGRVTVIPTVIDTEAYRPRDYAKPPYNGPVRVGWSGSDQSIHATLTPYLKMLAWLQTKMDFELVVVTNTRPQLPVPELRWQFHPWHQDEEPFLESKFDIGIMPLVDNEFQKGKCGLKLLQYMAAGLPTVASPVGVNKEIVRQGVTGILARTETEWQDALGSLIRDAALRSSCGQAGRRVCEQEYSIRRWLPVLTRIFEQTCQEETHAHANHSAFRQSA